MLKRKLENKDYIQYALLILFGTIIFIVSIRHIQELTNLMAWDELGYWGNAAYLSGYDWSSVVSAFAGYYSYGYSLILALLIRFLAPYGYAYQGAILINGLFLTSSFYLSYYVGISYFGKEKRNLILLVALAVGFYANSITQANYAWTECILIFLYWTLVALFCSINRSYHFTKLLLIGGVSIYILFVHARSIGIVIASYAILLLMFIYKEIPLRDWLFFLILNVIIIALAWILKQDIRNSVWVFKSNSEIANTIESTTPWMLGKLKSLYGIVDLIKTFSLRFFYFGLTTFMFFFVFLQTAVKKLWASIKERKVDFCLAFLILSMLGVFGVMSIQLSQAGSYQALLYGRYQDIIVGPFFLFGLLYFICDSKKRKYGYEFAAYAIVLFILYKVAESIPIYTDYFVVNCNVELYRYWLSTKEGGYNLFLPILISFTVFLSMCCIRYLYIKKIKIIIIILGCASLLFCYREYTASEKIYENIYNEYYGMTEFLQEAPEICKGEHNIFYFNATDMGLTTPMAFLLQFRMYEYSLSIISSVENLEEGDYLFVPCEKISDSEYIPTVEVKGKLMISDKWLALYQID